MMTCKRTIKKRVFLFAIIFSLGWSLNGCDFISSIIEMFSSGAGGATAEATSEAVGGQAGQRIGAVAGDLAKDAVKDKATEMTQKNNETSDTGVSEDTSVSVDGD